MNPFKPDHRYPSLADVPIEEFAGRGIRGVLLDIDNTLVPYGEYRKITPENMEWLKRAEKCGVRCILYSNASRWKIREIVEVSGLKGVPKAYKPSWHRLNQALEILGCRRNEVLLIGDQACTDILGGNWGGVETVLVEPLTDRDWIGTKLLRLIEWLVLPDRRPWSKR